MSTKIYTGYKLETPSLNKINKIFNDISKEISLIAKEEAAKLIAENFFKSFDRKWSKNKVIDNCGTIELQLALTKKLAPGIIQYTYGKEEERLLLTIYETILCSQKLSYKEGLRAPDQDFGLRIWVYPYNSKKTLFFVDCEKRSYWPIIDKYLTPYGYWNNTDRPDDITKNEWNRRGLEWNNVLDNQDYSLKFELFCNDDFPLPGYFEEDVYELIFKHIPSKEERAKNLAANIIKNKKINELYEQLEDKSSYSFIYEAMDFIKSEDGKKLVNELAQEKINEIGDITIETLKTYNIKKDEGKNKN